MWSLRRLTPRRGQWGAPPLNGRDTVVLMSVFSFAALWRALDYATGVDGVAAAPNSTLGTVEQAFPLAVWSGALATGAGLVLLGLAGRWNRLVATGSAILALVYLGLAVGLGVESLGRPWLDGIRGASGLVVPVVWHVITASHATALRRALADPNGGRCARSQ